MTTPAQKARERSFLELLQKGCPELAGRSFVDGHEPPDFESGIVGVEIVEFHRGSGPKGSPAVAVEKARTQVRRLAEAEYRERGGQNVLVHLFFQEGAIPKSRWEALAREIAATVLARPPAPSSSATVEWDDLGPIAQDHLHNLSLGWFGIMEWESLQGGWVTGDVDEVERLIRQKEADLPEMRERVKETWLLVVAPGTNPVAGQPDLHFASMLTDLSEFGQRTWSFGFDRVYVADFATGQLVRLTP